MMTARRAQHAEQLMQQREVQCGGMLYGVGGFNVVVYGLRLTDGCGWTCSLFTMLKSTLFWHVWPVRNDMIRSCGCQHTMQRVPHRTKICLTQRSGAQAYERRPRTNSRRGKTGTTETDKDLLNFMNYACFLSYYRRVSERIGHSRDAHRARNDLVQDSMSKGLPCVRSYVHYEPYHFSDTDTTAYNYTDPQPHNDHHTERTQRTHTNKHTDGNGE